MVRVERKSYFVAGAFLALLLTGLMVARVTHRASTADSAPTLAAKPEAISPSREVSSGAPAIPEMALTIKFRAVSLNKATGRPEADVLVAYSVLDEIRKSPAFDAEKTQVTVGLSANEDPGTVSWSIVAGLEPSMRTY